ncbi:MULTISPECIES: hypothetical protein [unclassified Streptomyces]|uniref:hypothetical protein n=1 Tax=unclassified Streptomyces TaxID=2593676 RepID=UPI001587F39D|nr:MULTISPECIES: hypothetical protein [unclassified Streptomyces]
MTSTEPKEPGNHITCPSGSVDNGHTNFLVHVDPWLTVTLNRPGHRPASGPPA